MIKRMNKVTSLLIAAAAVVSLMPATGVSAATKQLETKDGTIENAVAFKDGKYLYEGYTTENSDTGLYYNAGDKDTKLDTVTQIGAESKFDDKYTEALDGNDEYVVDLSAGTVTDNNTVTDLKDTSKAKLTTKLNKASRYNRDVTDLSIDTKVGYDNFGDVWYEYSATTSAALGATVAATKTALNGQATTPQAIYYGYTNEAGAYIDASYNANIYVYNGTSMTKIKNVGDTENGITLNSITPLATLGEDANYIYRVVEANVSGAVDKVKLTTGPNVTDATGTEYNHDGTGNTLYYVQKISKAQGDTEKDAYLPKSTDSYEISGATGSGDVADAYNAINKVITGSQNAVATIVDGAIYVTYNDAADKVKTEEVILSNSEKLNRYDGSTKLTTKVDGHVAKKNGDVSQDVSDVSTSSNGGKSWSVDTNGNVWAIKDGEIFKSSKLGSFESVYTCDRSFDKIDVYDDNNLIAWQDGGDAYTTIAKGTTETPVETPVTTTGWVNTASGWTFYNATGSQTKGQWVNDGGVWYMIKADGIMATGWYNDNGTWYFLNTSGAMKTGWVNDNGTWYFLNGSGAMKTGWVNDNGTWYYLNASGSMLANTTIDGYKLNASGAWVK